MWEFKYRKHKKVVEARARYAGADVLLTVSRDRVRLAMNGGVLLSPREFGTMIDDLAGAAQTAREVLDANG